MKLSEEKINKYKEELLEDKKSTENNLEQLKKDLDLGDETDPDTETDETEEFSNYIGIKVNLENQLENIESALERIESGTYGVCKKCGKNISEDVLDANPASTLCRECKKAM